jgi:hypothetical protein
MEANELRVGNYVNAEFGLSNLQTHKLLAQDILDISKGIVKIYPIPLTEEILLKCGFKLAIDEQVYVLHDTIELTQNDYGNSFYFIGNFIKSDIKYLHQLQNLYYALTDNEL